jgi:hypothetical protein
VTLFGTLALTIFFGPFHLLVTAIVEGALQALLSRSRTLVEATEGSAAPIQLPVLAWTVGYSVICLGIGFPFAYRGFVQAGQRQSAERRASAEWAAGKAAVYRSWDQDDCVYVGTDWVSYEFDRETGLELRRGIHAGWESYNRRIQELLAIHGPPPTSVKPYLMEPQELADLLDSKELVRTTSLPFQVTPTLRVSQSGEFLNLEVVRDPPKSVRQMSVGQGPSPVYVGQVGSAKEVAAVRYGNHWVGIFHPDGRLIASASRFP